MSSRLIQRQKQLAGLNLKNCPKNFIFFKCGITDCEGTAKFYTPENSGGVSYSLFEKPIDPRRVVVAKVHKLTVFLNFLGHKKIDVSKMDAEGAEYGVIKDLLTSNIGIEQIVEFQ